MKESPVEREARHLFYETVLGKGRCFFKGIISHPCAMEGEVIDPMHFIPKRRLEQIARLRGYDEVERINMKWDTRNGMPGCRSLHTRMDTGFLRIYQGQLPDEVFDFCDTWDLHNELADLYPEGNPPHE